MVAMTTIFYVPLYLQVLGHTPTQAGLRILATSFGVAVSSIACGAIMKKTGKYVGLGVTVLTVYTIGMCLIATLDGNAPNWVPFVAMALIGLGYGGMLTVTLLACIAAVDHTHQAVITSATYAFRSVGATLGITVASAVYQNVLRARLWDRFGNFPGAAEEIEKICDDLKEIAKLPEGWYEGVVLSFMEAFRGVWVMSLGLVAAGLVSVSLMRQHKLHSNLARQEE